MPLSSKVLSSVRFSPSEVACELMKHHTYGRELDNDAHLNEPFARGCHEVTCEESRTLRKKREEAAKKAGDASKGKQKKVEGKKKK